MSASKFIMAQKLQRVQVKLMAEEITDTSLSGLLQLIYQKCYEESLTFWFNFLEDACVLNLRDVEHENTELNIRYAYPSIPLDMEHINYYKEMILRNAFLLTSSPVSIGMPKTAVDVDEPEEVLIIDSDGEIPIEVRVAVEKIKSKGIPVTAEAIRNHLPLSKMSTGDRIACNRYLRHMEE